MLGIQGLAHCACCCDAMGILLSEDKLELIVIAAVSSAVTATMVGEVQAMFSGMLKHMHKVTFPVLAGFASIDNYWMKDDKTPRMAHVLESIGLLSHQYSWIHNSDVTSGSGVQHGFIRLPAKSWILWFLSLLGCSNYIEIQNNLQNVTLRGPKAPINGLIELVGKCSNRPATEEELAILKKAFGIGEVACGVEAKLVVLETLLLSCVLSYFVWDHYGSPHSYKETLGYTVAILAFSRSCATHALDVCFRAACVRMRKQLKSFTGASNGSATASIQEPLLPGAITPEEGLEEQQEQVQGLEDTGVESMDSDEELVVATRVYSVVMSMTNWYEVTRQCRISCQARGPALETCCLHARTSSVRMVDDFLGDLRPKSSVVYVVPHNPFRDLHIKHLATELKKSRESICVVVVMPPFEHFLDALEAPVASSCSVSAQTNPGLFSDMRSSADFFAWLENFRSGIYEEWVVLFPIVAMSSAMQRPLFEQLESQWAMRR